MNSIIDKAKKILALVERGQDGEARAAKIALENLLEKHGFTIEDIKQTKRTERKFAVRGKEERSVFIHCLLKMFGRKSEVADSASSYKRDAALYADMTEIEYLEFKSFFQFHLQNYRKERNKLLANITSAYVNKHDLFAGDDSSNANTDDVNWDEVYQIMKLSDTMNSVSYFKSIES